MSMCGNPGPRRRCSRMSAVSSAWWPGSRHPTRTSGWSPRGRRASHRTPATTTPSGQAAERASPAVGWPRARSFGRGSRSARFIYFRRCRRGRKLRPRGPRRITSAAPGSLMASSEAPGSGHGRMWQRQADWTWGMIRRIHLGARRPANWAQLFQFGVVGAAGYVVNLAVFAVLTLTLDVQHIARGGPGVRRRRLQQLPVESSLDLQGVGRGGSRRVPGDALLRRQPRRAGGQPRGAGAPGGRPRGARLPVAGDRDRGRDAGELHRQQAVDVRLELASRVRSARPPRLRG